MSAVSIFGLLQELYSASGLPGFDLSQVPNDILKAFPGEDLPGISSPFCYFGETDSWFSLHLEDCGLLSVNYLHDGAPKVWFVVEPFEDLENDRKPVLPFSRGCCLILGYSQQ